MELSPAGILRASDIIKATVCSAAEMVLPPGVFITTTPLAVAALISILSTPTPARPMALRELAFAISSAPILVPLRMIQPSTSGRTAAILSAS